MLLGKEKHRLFIQVKKVSSGKLYGVKVLDERYKLIEEFPEIAEQDSMPFNRYKYNFTLTLRFIIENTFRSDHAGIDLTWETEAKENIPATTVAEQVTQ